MAAAQATKKAEAKDIKPALVGSKSKASLGDKTSQQKSTTSLIKN